jgi:hypothetical protein
MEQRVEFVLVYLHINPRLQITLAAGKLVSQNEKPGAMPGHFDVRLVILIVTSLLRRGKGADGRY